MSKFFGMVIREIRKRRKMTLQQVAAEMGVSYPAVQQWEVGKTTMSHERILRLCEVLKAYLFEITLYDFPSDADGVRLQRTVEYAMARFERDDVWRSEARSVGRDPDLFVKHKVERLRLNGRRNDLLAVDSIDEDDPDLLPIVKSGISDSGQVIINNNNIIDYILTPLGIKYLTGIFSIKNPVTSLSPRFNQGEIILIDEFRPISVGDYAVVVRPDTNENGNRVGSIGQVIFMPETEIVISQPAQSTYAQFSYADGYTAARILTMDDITKLDD